MENRWLFKARASKPSTQRAPAIVLSARSQRNSPVENRSPTRLPMPTLPRQSACSEWARRRQCRRLRKCRRSFVLSQRPLQIETEIRRLLLVNRSVQAKHLAPEHEVRCATDGLDADQLTRLLQECR